MLDILDKLQSMDGYVRLVLKSGKIIFGKPDCIVWDEDAEGWDTIKTIRVEPIEGGFAKYFKAEDIESFSQCNEKDIPSFEKSRGF